MLGKFRSKHEANPPNEPAGSALDDYLGYLRDSSPVEAVDGDTVLITLPFWSLAATKDCVVSGRPDGFRPYLKVGVVRRGSVWEVSDLGENLGVLAEIDPDEFSYELSDGAIATLLKRYSLRVGSKHSISIDSRANVQLGEAIHNIVGCVGTLDAMFTDAIRNFFGEPEGQDPLNLGGSRLEFYGRGGTEETPWRSENFRFRKGALIVAFEYEGRQNAVLALEREDPGVFDDPEVLFEVSNQSRGIGLWQVKEEDWYDPHPGIDYHFNVTGRGNFTVTTLQPDLGQSVVAFPYRTGGRDRATLAGPFRVGSKPVLANLRHDGADHFFVELVSIDGADACEVVDTDGQVHLEQHPVEVKPGKEYLLYAGAGGDWELELTEGY